MHSMGKAGTGADYRWLLLGDSAGSATHVASSARAVLLRCIQTTFLKATRIRLLSQHSDGVMDQAPEFHIGYLKE